MALLPGQAESLVLVNLPTRIEGRTRKGQLHHRSYCNNTDSRLPKKFLRVERIVPSAVESQAAQKLSQIVTLGGLFITGDPARSQSLRVAAADTPNLWRLSNSSAILSQTLYGDPAQDLTQDSDLYPLPIVPLSYSTGTIVL
jgi:hypothetical protein